MSNQRAPNQTLIAIAVHRKLLQTMDHTCSQAGEDRSTFIRHAIVNAIKAENGYVEEEWIRAQVRTRGSQHYAPSPLPPPAVKPGKPAPAPSATTPKSRSVKAARATKR